MHKFVDVHPLAVKETRKAHRWYARRNPVAAQQFQELLEQARIEIWNIQNVGPSTCLARESSS
jgi:hypothetical protein